MDGPVYARYATGRQMSAYSGFPSAKYLQEVLRFIMDKLEEEFFVGRGEGNDHAADFYLAALDGFYFIYGDHIGLMYPAYQVGRQQLFKFIEALQGHDFFVYGVDAQVIPHSLNVEDFTDRYFFKAVFGFYENKIGLFTRSALG
jgi:hypothetical protein